MARRKANEPLHVSYNYGDNSVEVMNNTGKTANDLTAEINVLDFGSKSVLKKSVSVPGLVSKQTRKIFDLPSGLDLSKTYFLDLKLFDKQHKNVSDNFYVLSTERDLLDIKKSTWYITPQSQYADLTLLRQLPKIKLQTSDEVSLKKVKHGYM